MIPIPNGKCSYHTPTVKRNGWSDTENQTKHAFKAYFVAYKYICIFSLLSLQLIGG